MSKIEALPQVHRDALHWFSERTGQEISWPKPLDGLFLVNKAKGIHKPRDWQHALSIRQTLDGPYADSDVLDTGESDWTYDYFQEGADPASRDKYAMNRALVRNMHDGVPIAVMRQVKRNPGSRYRVLGLATVESWNDGVFRIRKYAEGSSTGATDPSKLPLNLEDARKRIERAIVARQGSGAFRAAVIEAFGGKCAITGYNVIEGLEAAHIVPYLGPQTNVVTNALLLRADLHTLFDRGLIKIDPASFVVSVAESLRKSVVGELHQSVLRLPDQPDLWREAFTLCAAAPKDSTA